MNKEAFLTTFTCYLIQVLNLEKMYIITTQEIFYVSSYIIEIPKPVSGGNLSDLTWQRFGCNRELFVQICTVWWIGCSHVYSFHMVLFLDVITHENTCAYLKRLHHAHKRCAKCVSIYICTFSIFIPNNNIKTRGKQTSPASFEK